jgi:hypothetical protein
MLWKFLMSRDLLPPTKSKWAFQQPTHKMRTEQEFPLIALAEAGLIKFRYLERFNENDERNYLTAAGFG